ncbi:MAG: hypothetical protein KA118_04450 [Verrucomicrobia bacterium]|nr:hypothetical protein [Verrucomicrobiota bacterium]
MKTAYELAMERLGKSGPSPKLTDAQRKALAELDAKYTAKIAELELLARDRIAQAEAQGDAESAETIRQQLVCDRQSQRAELESRKEQVRQSAA